VDGPGQPAHCYCRTAPLTAGREVVEDYRSTGLSLRAHPLTFLRDTFESDGYARSDILATARNGSRVSIAGLVLVRQMPGSAKGMMFITLEDETANANLIVWPSVFEKSRRYDPRRNHAGVPR
jgi:error-prone DNA polymerase